MKPSGVIAACCVVVGLAAGCPKEEPWTGPGAPAASAKAADRASPAAGSSQASPSGIDGPTKRGFRPVDLELPRLHHEGGLWHLGFAPLGHVDGKDRTRQVVLEGKMVLDDSSPRRRRFWVAPHYDGCIDRHEKQHRPHWIEVQLPEGESIQVTDRRLFVQGRLAGGKTEDGQLRFEGVAVQLQRAALRTGDRR